MQEKKGKADFTLGRTLLELRPIRLNGSSIIEKNEDWMKMMFFWLQLCSEVLCYLCDLNSSASSAVNAMQK